MQIYNYIIKPRKYVNDIKMQFVVYYYIPSKRKSDAKDKVDFKERQKEDQQKKEDEQIYHVITFHFYVWKNLYHPSHRVHCDGCEKDITKQSRVQCIDCPSNICWNCVLNLQEFKQHVPQHHYRLLNKLNFALFVQDWSAEEELMLIEGLERKGFGNWEDIADMLGRSIEQVEQHYNEFYLELKDLPVLSARDPQTLDLVGNWQVKKSADRVVTRAAQPTQPKSSVVQDIVGYWPKRGDFDIEYDNDAELLLAEMEFTPEDKDQELDMKMKVLDIYNLRMDERYKRKQFVIERDLLNLKKQNFLEKQRTKDEKEFYNIMKPFARFNTPEAHEKLVQGLIRERQIRARIEELRHYRKAGMKTFQEVEAYLEEKRKKDDAFKRKQKQSDAFVYDKAPTSRLGQRRTRFVSTAEKRSSGMSEQEHTIIEKLGVSPQEYLVMKEVMVRECVRLGYIKKDQALQTFKLDRDRVSCVYDFLIQRQAINEQ